MLISTSGGGGGGDILGGAGDGGVGGGGAGGNGGACRRPQSSQSVPQLQKPRGKPKATLLSFGPPSWHMSFTALQTLSQRSGCIGGSGGG